MGRPGLPCNGQSREIRTVHAGKACLYRIAKVHCFSPGSTANMNVSVARSLDAKQLILSAYRNFKKESQLKQEEQMLIRLTLNCIARVHILC